MQVDENVGRAEPEAVSEVEARLELDRLLSDPRFRATDRNKAFLKFISEEYFNGRSALVKAYTIAVDVFGRSCSFDATTDPIVRIEATRLRAALSQYYESHVADDAVRIELPRGRYVPVFTRSPSAIEKEEYGIDDADPPSEMSVSGTKSVLVNRRLLVCAGGVLALFALWNFWDPSRAFTQKPRLTVEMKLNGDSNDREAEFIRDHFISALSKFQTVTLGNALQTASDPVKAQGSFALDSAGPTKDDTRPYHLLLRYYRSEDTRSVWWQIVSPVTGEILGSGVEKVAGDENTGNVIPQKLVSHLAVRFGSTAGIVNGLELARELDAPADGNGCVLRSAWAVDRRLASELPYAESCLQTTLKAAPNNADANAQLAIVLLEKGNPDVSGENISLALKLADKAAALAPTSDRAAYARMLAQFSAGRTEAAIASGYQAMSLNPNNSAIPARMGTMLFAMGRWAEGVGLATKAGMIDDYHRAEASLTLALDAYRRGEFADALLQVRRFGDSDGYLDGIVELAAAGQIGNGSIARDTTERLSSRHHDFRTTFHADMLVRHYTPEIVDLLWKGLEKADEMLPPPIAGLSAN